MIDTLNFMTIIATQMHNGAKLNEILAYLAAQRGDNKVAAEWAKEADAEIKAANAMFDRIEEIEAKYGED